MTAETMVTVLRNPDGDCTNNGVSSRTGRVILIGEFDKVPEDPLFPVLRIKRREDYIYCEPVDEVPEGHVGWMMGGNFAYASDSRFRKDINTYPIAIHDRSEIHEQNAQLSI